MRQKDYPRQLVVGESIWTVKFVRQLKDERGNMDGLCDPGDQILYIKMGQKPKDRFKAFVHEVLHIFEAEYGIKLSSRNHDLGKDLVYQLEEPIFRLLVDNGLIAIK